MVFIGGMIGGSGVDGPCGEGRMTCIAARVRRRVDGGTRRDARKRARQPAAPTSWVRDARDPTVGKGGNRAAFRGIFWLALGAPRAPRASVTSSRGATIGGTPIEGPCGARPLPSLRTSRAASPRSSLSRVNAKEGTVPIPTSPLHRRSRRWRGSRDASTFSEGTKKTRRRRITRTTDATSTMTSRTLGPWRGASPRDARS